MHPPIARSKKSSTSPNVKQMETLTRKLKFLATKTKTQLDADERVKQPQKNLKFKDRFRREKLYLMRALRQEDEEEEEDEE